MSRVVAHACQWLSFLLSMAFILGNAALAEESANLPVFSSEKLESLPRGSGYHEFVRFSPDGKFLAVRIRNYGNDRVRIYDSHSHVIIDEIRAHRVYMEGFIDENTWFTTIVEQEKDEEFVRVRTLSPVGEIFARRMERGGRHSDANEQYIAFSGELIDWKNDKNYLTRLSVPWSSGLAVTREGLVLLGVSNGILQSDPVHGEEIKGWGMDLWQFALTPDERHLITVSDTGACKLWQFPERKEIGTCRRGNFFDLDIKPNLALSPDGTYFALTVENEIQVYRVDPFVRIMKVDMPENIYSLAISNNGILALGMSLDTEIWNAETGKALGICTCSLDSENMSLRPDGRQLAIGCLGDLLVFDISGHEGVKQ